MPNFGITEALKAPAAELNERLDRIAELLEETNALLRAIEAQNARAAKQAPRSKA